MCIELFARAVTLRIGLLNDTHLFGGAAAAAGQTATLCSQSVSSTSGTHLVGGMSSLAAEEHCGISLWAVTEWRKCNILECDENQLQLKKKQQLYKCITSRKSGCAIKYSCGDLWGWGWYSIIVISVWLIFFFFFFFTLSLSSSPNVMIMNLNKIAIRSIQVELFASSVGYSVTPAANVYSRQNWLLTELCAIRSD